METELSRSLNGHRARDTKRGVRKGVNPIGNGGPRVPGRATDVHVLKEPALEMETGPRGPRTGAEGDLNRAGGGWWRFYQGKTREQMGSSWPVVPRVQGTGESWEASGKQPG